VFFCKDIFGEVPKSLSGKVLDGLLDKSNFLGIRFLSLILQFEIIHLPGLVPARPG
jgi:hypothetical protein